MKPQGIPLGFKLLDPEAARSAIDGLQDILSAEHLKAEALYRQHRKCPHCELDTMAKYYGGTTFAFSDDSWHIPRCLMRCENCGCVRNPFDGMIVEVGDPDRAAYGNIPIIKG